MQLTIPYKRPMIEIKKITITMLEVAYEAFKKMPDDYFGWEFSRLCNEIKGKDHEPDTWRRLMRRLRELEVINYNCTDPRSSSYVKISCD